MKVEIRKYKKRDEINSLNNYFDRPNLIDSLTLNNTMNDGFPIYNEEFENKYDTFEILASDYDVNFSLLQPELSQLGNDIESFFTLEESCIMAVKITIDNKLFGGIVDLETIEFDYTKIENRWDIKFSVFSIEKEFKDFVQGSPTTPSFSLNTFSSYIGGSSGVPFFRADNNEVLPSYFTFDFSNLNWIERCGYEPVLVHEVWSELISAGAIPNDCTCWTLFEDLCKGFGLIFKIRFGISNNGDYFSLKMYLGFRDTGFSSNVLNIYMKNHKEGYKIDNNTNDIQIFKFGKVVGSGNTDPDESVFYGLVFDSTRDVTIDGAAIGNLSMEFISGNNDGVFLNEIRSTFPAFISNEPINFVEFNHYIKSAKYSSTPPIQGWDYYVFATPHEANNESMIQYLTRKAYPFPRFWTKAGYSITTSNWRFFDAHNIIYIDNIGSQNTHDLWYSLIESTTTPCYTYLLSSFRKTLSTKVSLLNGFNLNLFDKTNVNGRDYILQKLNSLDLDKKTVQSEWLETKN